MRVYFFERQVLITKTKEISTLSQDVSAVKDMY